MIVGLIVFMLIAVILLFTVSWIYGLIALVLFGLVLYYMFE